MIALIAWSGRSPRGGNSTPLQCSCLGNFLSRGAWQVTVHGGLKESDMTEHTHTHTSMFALSKFLKKIKAVLFHKSQGVREELQVSKN